MTSVPGGVIWESQGGKGGDCMSGWEWAQGAQERCLCRCGCGREVVTAALAGVHLGACRLFGAGLRGGDDRVCLGVLSAAV